MAQAARAPDYAKWATGLTIAFLIACFVFGGASRADALSQFFVRAAAVVIGSTALFMISRDHLAGIATPLALCGAWTAWMLIQLIPLPPAIWTSLPGREMFVDLASIVGIAQPWRPISLAPEATANSVLAMLVPLTMLVVVSQVPSRRIPLMLLALVALAMVSGVIGVAQVASDGALYFYNVTNRGDAVGLFANRNHQAALLAATVPVLAGLANLRQDPKVRQKDGTLALIAFALIFPLIFATGSRAGLLLLAVGIAVGALVLFKGARGRLSLREVATRPLVWISALGIAVGGAALALFRVGAVERILARDLADDMRFSIFDTLTSMAATYFPVGGGFGAFTPLFKISEPFSLLSYFYVNHAHNEALEIVIEGGLPAALIALAFLGWAAVISLRIWRRPLSVRHPELHLAGLVASAVLLILLLASLADYPLRTPALGAVAALAVAVVHRANRTLSAKEKVIGDRVQPGRL